MALSISAVLTEATQRLMVAGCDTPQLDAQVLLAHTLHKDRTWLYLYGNKKQLEPKQQRVFFELVEQRAKREPVAYIIGHKEFYALDFVVNPYVLIPRPETELLVETAIQIANSKLQNVLNKSKIQNLSQSGSSGSTLKIVDVGTGSGCIAITLAKYLVYAQILAIDISQAVLDVARQNADRHHVAQKITFYHGNLLESLTDPVDMIVSNPPYIKQSELIDLMPEVNQFEPQTALIGGFDGLEIIEQLLSQAKEKLKPKGSVLVEIGSQQGQTAKELAQVHFSRATIQIKPDLAGLDRLLVIQS